MTQAEATLQLLPAAVAEAGEALWETYFPADLPQDWQLAFYAHSHRRLLLPARLWPGTAGAAFGPWDEAVPATLRLSLEWPGQVSPEEGAAVCRALAAEIGECLEAVLVPAADPATVDAIAAALRAAGLERLRIGGPAQARPLAHAREARFHPFAAGPDGHGAWVIDPEPGLDPAAWRELVEALLAAGGHGPTPVFLRTQPERLADLRTIIRLLGAA